jgi:predicted metal-dependent hydrolase
MKIRKFLFEDHINPENIDTVWMQEDPFMSHLLNALSFTFPGGEDFFRRSVKEATYVGQNSPQVVNEDLRVFSGQEALHSRVHKKLNAVLASKLKGPTPYLEEAVNKVLLKASEYFSEDVNLSITCALEHATAILAEVLLTSPELMESMAPVMSELWSWHAIEELEHKGVAFDVYRARDFDYETRVVGLVAVTLILGIAISAVQLLLMLLDECAKPSVVLDGLKRLWVRPGYMRKAIPAWLSYLKDGFHPRQRRTDQFVTAYDLGYL